MPAALDGALLDALVQVALEEDAAGNDITTDATVPREQGGSAELIARQHGVVCGLPFAWHAFTLVDADLSWTPLVEDGAAVDAAAPIARVAGSLHSILRAERVALNFLQRLSGIATATRSAVEATAGTGARILDTRKTTPGLRAAERYAVRIGGGGNHRDDLSAGILIKDNHVAAMRAGGGSLADAVAAALAAAGPATGVEIEVRSLEELDEALQAGARFVLLDNFADELLATAVTRAHQQGAAVEASGGITLERLPRVAAAGVDFISMGALTHSPAALDIALDLVPN